MSANMRPLLRIVRLQSALSRSHQVQRTYATQGGPPNESSEQAMPLGPYYEAILASKPPKSQPVREAKSEEATASSSKPPRPSKKAKKAKRDSDKPKPSPPSSREGSPSPQSRTGTTTTSSSTSTVSPQPPAKPATTQEQTRIIFGSRLAGPAERADRLQSIRDRSTLIAGIRVPPRPEEPDNCCMSGCVNCVWDRYRDEMEEWATASALAKKAQQAQELEGESWSAIKDTSALSRSSNTAASMDDDGGGSETNWQAGETAKTDRSQIAKDLWDDGLYNNVPVGIREFMKHEKKLKEKHKKEGTFGG
ncbi:oxidoreductase-like protein [Xylaria nigripes]|nr:oxidoreductase-like protein [Xylaria nigripes]